MAGANPSVREHMKWAETQREEITRDAIQIRSPDCEQTGKQLYLALSLQVKNEELTTIKSVEMQNGLEAWMQLVEE